MVANQTDGEFFRCPVPAERSVAELRLKRSRLLVHVQEASIDGFTVLVDSRDAGKLQMGIPWVMLHDETKIEVHAEWFYHAANGHVQIGLRRLRDLTRPPRIGDWCPRIWVNPREASPAMSCLIMSGVLLMIFVSLATPGLGDAFGTAEPIQAGLKIAVKTTIETVTGVVYRFVASG